MFIPSLRKSSRPQAQPISKEQLRALLARRSQGAPYMGNNRRDNERHTLRKAAHVVIEMGFLGGRSRRLLVRTRDVSAQGVGFLHSEPLLPGTRCRLMLLRKTQGLTHCRGVVASCAQVSPGLFAVGVALKRALAVNELALTSDAA